MLEMKPIPAPPGSRKRCLRARAAIVLAAFVFPFAGCADSASGQWTGSISDSAGIRVVANPLEGLWGESETWVLVEELTISDREIPGLEFGAIDDVDADSRGRILVLDDMVNEYHVFSPDGEYLRSVGGAGGGPGEFNDPFQILVLPGDSVLVPDVGNTRANVFGPDGSLARTFPVDALDLGARRWAVSGDGDVIARRSQQGSLDALLRLDAAGAVQDTVARLIDSPQPPEGGFVLLAPVPVWSVLPAGGVAYGHSHAYRITVADSGGARLVFSRPLASDPLSGSQRNFVEGGMQRVLGERGAPPDFVEQFMVLYDSPPVIANLLGGPENTIWVQRTVPVEDVRFEDVNIYRTDAYRADAWDVFDADGRYLGEVVLPPGFELFRIRGDRLYGIRLDEFDVPIIMRFRLERGAADT